MKSEKDIEGYDYYNAGSAKIRVRHIKENEYKIKAGRHYVTVFVIIAVFVAFGGILFNAQIIKGDEYALLGSTSVSSSVVKATRGNIYDRNGVLLVGNRQGNTVVFNASEFPSLEEQENRNAIILSLINLFEKNNAEWIDELPIVMSINGNYEYKEDSDHEIKVMLGKDLLNLNRYATADDCMNELIKKYKLEDFSKSDARKIASVCYQLMLNGFNSANEYRFAEDVDANIVAYLKERSAYYKGVDVKIEAYREYYDGTLAPHILGMVGAIDAEEYEELSKKGYGMNDLVGKSGIEQLMEETLRGKDGVKTVISGTDGTTTTEFSEPVENGNNVVLTIDAGAQKVAQDALEQLCESIPDTVPHGGSVVAIDCNTGEVLISATYPSYDLNTYNDDYDELLQDDASPLWNRALQSVYAPGSTSKPSVALAGLEEGAIDENTTFECHYTYKYLDMTFGCVANHKISNIDVRTALQDSCNTFFYNLGIKLGVEKMNTYRQLLGLGQPTGIELPENTGVLDSPSYRTSINQEWMPGFTIQSAIGQAGNLFSPVQLANYCATIANGGTRYSVHLIKEVKNTDLSETVYEKKPEVVVETGLHQENIDIVKQGMKRVITNSLVLNSSLGKIVSCAAKTGTSEVEHNIDGKKAVLTNGFFITFAPYDNPQIAIAVAIEGGQSGSSCAPVAEAIYQYYFGEKDTTENNTNQQTGTLIG